MKYCGGYLELNLPKYPLDNYQGDQMFYGRGPQSYRKSHLLGVRNTVIWGNYKTQ